MKFVSRHTFLSAALALVPVLCHAQGYVIKALPGDRVHLLQAPPSTSQSLDIFGPGVLATNASGDVYVAVRDGIFRVDASGTPLRMAGTEHQWRYSGDGGPAIRAGLNPRSLALDDDGNLYIADSGNNRIRKLAATTGVITTVAGNGIKGFSGDGGPATGAQLNGPTGVALDPAGNLYIADGTADGTNRIRRVAAATGVITTVAGTGTQGYSGDGGPATSAQFSSLGGLATDAAGNLYIADNYNNRIRMVSAATGIITTVAGSGAAGHTGDGGLATSAELNNPLSVAVDALGNLYIADSANYRIRKVTAATGTIATLVPNGSVADADSSLVYKDAQHGFPCALALDASGNLYIADSGVSRIRTVRAGTAIESVGAAPLDIVQSLQTTGNFKINVTYNASVPAAAQTAFNSLVATYQSLFSNTLTVNLNVNFGNVVLGQSATVTQDFTYSTWRSILIASAAANPGNPYIAAAAASLPANDPIGAGNVYLTSAYARALGFNVNTAVDSTLTFNSSPNTFEYNGVAAPGLYDFQDTAAHELDEALGISSALTGLSNNASLPRDRYAVEDYFRYSAAGTRAITTNPNAVVYFSYNGGATNVAQFNQDNGEGDRNDWIYGSNCPGTAPGPYIQDAVLCSQTAVPIGQTSSPEVIVLTTLGYQTGSAATQTITFNALSNVTFGVAPFTISATASSLLTVSFTSTTTSVCTVSASTVTIVATGTCSITASQAGNTSYAAAPNVIQSFTVSPASQTITFNPISNVALNTAPFNLTATASSTLPVKYVSNTASVCSVSGSTVTILISGGCSITASQPGNANYTAATPVTQRFTVLFADIQPTDFDANAADLLAQYGITSGCGNNDYCPNANVTRAQMAIFMVRAIEGGDNFTFSAAPYFSDVQTTDFGFKWIQKMKELGITAGCTATAYCPNDNVTRAQMAIFIVRARLGVNLAGSKPSFSYSATPSFTDVAAGDFGFAWIQRMKRDSVTAGCTATTYCPNDPVTRGQMAIFIMRAAFNLLLPVNTPVLTQISPSILPAGTSGTFTITGTNTNFVQGTTTISPLPGVTIGTVTVNSPTSLTVQLTAAANAAAQPYSVLAVTGTEEAVLPNGLTIQ